MNRWLMIVLGSAAAVAAWALPPTTLVTPERPTPPEEARLEVVEREVRRAHGLLRALRWSDSLSALVAAAGRGSLVLGPPRAPAIEPAAIRVWQDAERRAFSTVEPRDARMAVGVFWQRFDHGAVPGLPVAGSGRAVTFVGERGGTPYCIRALPYGERSTSALLRFETDLGPCRLYASYGLPGERVRRWLEASALGFARTSDPAFAAELARAQSPEPRRPALLGLGRPSLPEGDLTTQACSAGRPSACERALTDPELITPSFPDEAYLVAHSPVSGLEDAFPSRPFGHLDDGLLYELEAQFGPDAFSRFWTSPEEVPQAFQAAFGVPLGAWAVRWVEGHLGLYRAGPSLPWSTLLSSLFVLAALAAFSTAIAQRRRCG